MRRAIWNAAFVGFYPIALSVMVGRAVREAWRTLRHELRGEWRAYHADVSNARDGWVNR